MWDDICSYLLMDLKHDLLNQHDVFLCEPRIVQFRSIKVSFYSLCFQVTDFSLQLCVKYLQTCFD